MRLRDIENELKVINFNYENLVFEIDELKKSFQEFSIKLNNIIINKEESIINKEAEYIALIQGLKHVLDKEIKSITIYSDSQLIVNQINGKYQVKNERMILCYQKATDILSNFNSWTLIHIPREKNKEADFLSKQGMQV